MDQDISRVLDGPAKGTSRGPHRVLLAGIGHSMRDELLTVLDQPAFRWTAAAQMSQVESAVDRQSHDVIVIGASLGPAIVDAVASMGGPSMGIIYCGECSSASDIVELMRAGASDVLDPRTCTADEVRRSICAVAEKAREARCHEQHIDRLKRVCRELNIARRQVNEQVDGLCNDLASAYRDIAEQMNEVAMTTEFRTLIRQELDVEDLLRTTLEYLLTKTGPTNAAVFLPDHAQNFGLGAYVNYDCPRETVSVLLDHLCEAICPQMAEEQEIVLFDDSAEFSEWVGIESGFMDDSQVMAFSCMHEGECLAVIVLFRNRSDAFELQLAATIDLLRTIFAEQLATIVRVHHRASPEWPEDMHEDDTDYNDDYGFGYGGGGSALS
jgi:DNA-binding response OmpR family regulator